MITVTTTLSGEQLAEVNTSSGVSSQTGKYFIPLGEAKNVAGTVTVLNQYFNGPLACTLCQTGVVSVQPPVIIHTGPLQSIP